MSNFENAVIKLVQRRGWSNQERGDYLRPEHFWEDYLTDAEDPDLDDDLRRLIWEHLGDEIAAPDVEEYEKAEREAEIEEMDTTKGVDF